MSYLNRNNTSLNGINYVDTLANSNKILERTGNGRNNIQWSNPPSSIPSGLNATPSQVLSGYKFVGSAGSLQTGTMPTQGGSTITPGTANKTAVSAGRYVSGNVIVAGDADLTAANIRYGKNIFGVNGNIREYKFVYTKATTSSRRSFTDRYTSTTFYAYILTINPGFTVDGGYAHMVNNAKRLTVNLPWDEYVLFNMATSTITEHNLKKSSSGLSSTASKLEIPVIISGEYDVWYYGYV